LLLLLLLLLSRGCQCQQTCVNPATAVDLKQDEFDGVKSLLLLLSLPLLPLLPLLLLLLLLRHYLRPAS
jgi:hypothetical protein